MDLAHQNLVRHPMKHDKIKNALETAEELLAAIKAIPADELSKNDQVRIVSLASQMVRWWGDR